MFGEIAGSRYFMPSEERWEHPWISGEAGRVLTLYFMSKVKSLNQ